MRHVASAMLFIVGVIHLLPLSGVLGAERLGLLYGLQFHEPNLAILMRHRAVLFGLLGAFFIAAAFQPSWQAHFQVPAANNPLSSLAPKRL